MKRLQGHLGTVFPAWNVSLPSDSFCGLTATKNIVGRLLNGIDESRVCTDDSNANLATGEFIHIEQAYVSRVAASYDKWTSALIATFPVAFDGRDTKALHLA